MFRFFLMKMCSALSGVAQWVWHCSEAKGCWFDSPSGHILGCRPVPTGGVQEATDQWFSNIDVSLPLFHSKNKSNLSTKPKKPCF